MYIIQYVDLKSFDNFNRLLTISLIHPKLIRLFYFQRSFNILVEILSTVKFGLEWDFSFTV